MLTEHLPRVSIAHLPTPLEALPRLSQRLAGPEIWIKRDDQTGLATGGNKARKLEFLIADALQDGADTLMTAGAVQSNHARQTAAAAAKFGLACTLTLRGTPPATASGNLLLDRLLGADVIWCEGRPLEEVLEATAERLRAAGRAPYIIPYGGSNPIGASGYAAAMEELLGECDERQISFDHIAFASSSGGTQAGLTLAARELGYAGQLLGISVDLQADALQKKLAALTTETAAFLGLDHRFESDDFVVVDGYLGAGYGIVSDLERQAVRTMAESEGVLLDPVYTGRAFGGLVDLIREGAFPDDGRLLFWHTGGTTGLFAYGEEILI